MLYGDSNETLGFAEHINVVGDSYKLHGFASEGLHHHTESRLIEMVLYLIVLSWSKLASISSSRRNGVPRAELMANWRATDAIAFSPPESCSLISKTYLGRDVGVYFLFGGVVV
jgi:hypothetical protein